ncbi:MAG: T9SS type A sorting domain-containing protein [Saprospiraceae bacterium]|nr:T9SS type A sorting domain-containing protein [Saprospiraceae bacterium]
MNVIIQIRIIATLLGIMVHLVLQAQFQINVVQYPSTTVAPCDGILEVIQVEGETVALNYLWSNGSTLPAPNGLCPGLYSVQITESDPNSSQCSWTLSFQLEECDLKECYLDQDGDGYGAGTATMQCGCPDDYVEVDGDCDDTDPNIHPGAAEDCSSTDFDCNGDPTLGAEGSTIFYRDADGDGYGDAENYKYACSQPSGYISNNEDCDDNDEFTHPGAVEQCDGKDNNCNGLTDQEDGLATFTVYRDNDLDGWGDITQSKVACEATPYGYTSQVGDCRDDDPLINPDAPEICDGKDNNCLDGVDDNVTCITFSIPSSENLSLPCSSSSQQIASSMQAWLNPQYWAQYAQSGCTSGTVTITNNYAQVGPVTKCMPAGLDITFTVTESCSNQTATATVNVKVEGYTPMVVLQAPQDGQGFCESNAFESWYASHGGMQVTNSCNSVTWTSSDPRSPGIDDGVALLVHNSSFSASDGCTTIVRQAQFLDTYTNTCFTIDQEPQNFTVDPCVGNPTNTINTWLNSYGGLDLDINCETRTNLSLIYSRSLNTWNGQCGTFPVTFQARMKSDADPIYSKTVNLIVGANYSLSFTGGSDLTVKPCEQDQASLIDAWIDDFLGANPLGSYCGNLILDVQFNTSQDVYADLTTGYPRLDENYCRFNSFKNVPVTITAADQCGNSTQVTKTLKFQCNNFDVSIIQNCEQLEANVSGNATSLEYKWLKNGVPINNSNVAVYTPTSAGNYKVEVRAPQQSNGLGCFDVASQVTFDPPCNSASVSLAASGTTLTATANSCLDVQKYVWTRPNGTTVTNTTTSYSNSFTMTDAGTYRVQVFLAGGCTIQNEELYLPPNTFECGDIPPLSYSGNNGSFPTYSIRITSDICLGINYQTACIPDHLDIWYAGDLILSEHDISTNRDNQGCIGSYPNAQIGLQTSLEIDFIPGYEFVDVITSSDYPSNTGFTLKLSCNPPGQCQIPSDNQINNVLLERIENINHFETSVGKTRIFPIPTSKELNIEIDLKNRTQAKTTLLDILGRVVYERESDLLKGLNKYNINTTTWPDGIYFLSITDETGVLHQQKIEIIHR